MLYSALSLAAQAGIGIVGANAVTDGKAYRNEYAKQQDNQESERDHTIAG